MDHKSIKLSCRYCKEEKTMQSIVQHAVKSKCPYTKEQISSLRKQSKYVSDAKKKIRMAELYQKNKAKIKEAHQKEKIDDPDKCERKKMDRARKYRTEKIEHPDKYAKKKKDRALKYQTEKIEHPDQYDRKKKKRAMKYQIEKNEHPDEYEKKRKERIMNYDASERAKRYKAERFEVASKYQKRKFETMEKGKACKVKNYDKTQRTIKYKNELARIKEKREEIKKNKESEAGKYFEKEIFDPILYKVRDKMVDDHYLLARGIVMEEYESHCNEAMNATFEEEFWIKEFGFSRNVTDCERNNSTEEEPKPCSYWTSMSKKPCIHHMTDEELVKLTETVLKKCYKRKKDEIIENATKDVFDMEWEHAMNMYPENGACTFYRVADRTTNKAFATIFKQKFISMYEKAYKKALDKFMVSNDSALVWKYVLYDVEYEGSDEKQMDRDFNCILSKELEVPKSLLHDEIVEMVEDEFYLAFLKKWHEFKTDIRNKMISCNERRMQWAWKKLGEIQITFKNRWTEDEMKEFMKDNLYQLNEIHRNYEMKILNADELNSVEMDQYFCFTYYIKTYPDLDFMDKAYSGDERINSMDDYGCFIENLWLQLDVEGEKCGCPECTKGICKIDCYSCEDHPIKSYHKHYWADKCEKIIRQRLQKRSYRSCYFCQKNIPTEEFEEVESLYYKTFTRLHQDSCAKKHGFLTMKELESRSCGF